MLPPLNSGKTQGEQFLLISGTQFGGRSDTSILVGISAIRKKELKLGDVVGSSQVWEIDRGAKIKLKTKNTSEESKTIQQPEYKSFALDNRIRNQFDGFKPIRYDWLCGYQDCVTKLENTNELIVGVARAASYEPTYKSGSIVSSQYVRRDNIWDAFAEHNDRKILAIEMEGAGFCAACDENNVRWVIFRGGADFGDSDKGDNWHGIAALNAALAASSFISNSLKFPKQNGEQNGDVEF